VRKTAVDSGPGTGSPRDIKLDEMVERGSTDSDEIVGIKSVLPGWKNK
jgi:hypothetical protein